MNWNSTSQKEIRKFGLTAFIFFAILSSLGILFEKAVPTSFFGILALIGMCFIIVPEHTKPVYKLWLRIAYFVSKSINLILLTAAYYLVITPFAIIKRLFGGRPLPFKVDKKIDTYWVERSEPVQAIERFIKRY